MKPDTAPLFVGCATALVTPMLPAPAGDGYTPPPVDYEAFVRLVRRQIAAGVDALVVCGTTGESSTLTDEEKLRLFSLAVQESRRAEAEGIARRHIPVIAGTGSNNTARAVTLSRLAEKAGCDGLLAVTPYYNKASQSGLVQHFSAIADAVDIPVILYNVPSRTGVGCTAQTYQALAKHPNIAGVKEASDDFDLIQDTLNLCPPGFTVWSGNDGSTAAIMALGGKGVISVAANVVPREMHELTQLCLENRFLEAGTLQLKLHELIRALFCEVNPIPVKAAMELLGLCSGELRLPLCRISERHLEQLSSALKPFRASV